MNTLERIQYHCALTITGACQGTNLDKNLWSAGLGILNWSSFFIFIKFKMLPRPLTWKILPPLHPYSTRSEFVLHELKFLKEVATEISPALTLLFNASILQSIIPTDWKEALINPIYKKGKNDRGIAENYRPISLTSVTCKLLEHIIHSNIIKHLEANEILSDTQHGFRKRRGRDTQLVMVVNDFAKNLNYSQQLDTILLDFSKAFDKVNHHKLLIKMDHYGIRGKLQDWMKDFLSERTQQVVVNGESSTKEKVNIRRTPPSPPPRVQSLVLFCSIYTLTISLIE